MIELYLVLKGLFFTWTGWVFGRLRGDGENGAGQSLNVSKGWDQFMIGLGLTVMTFPIIGWLSLLLIPLQIMTWSITWGSLRDLGRSENWDHEVPPFIKRFFELVGFPTTSVDTPFIIRFWRDYIGWTIRALMISSIGLAPLYISGWTMYLIPSFMATMFLFDFIDKDWMKWVSWIPVVLLVFIPMYNLSWIGFIGLLFPLQEWICQRLEEREVINSAWTWAESLHGATLFLGVYLWSVLQ